MSKKALITGITGQDGSYLAELLLSEGYKVYGIQRRTSTIITERIDNLLNSGKVFNFYGDLADTNSIVKVLLEVRPDEVYNIGSMSHVRVSFDVPEYTAQVTGVAPTRILEALRSLKMDGTKFYQASSSEMFGISPPPQSEETPMLPVSPYGCAKLYAYHMTRTYRFGYNMFACNGILFNHESERRGETFVTKKIVRAAVRIKLGLQEKIRLGNLSAMRDWGHVKDYVRAMYMIMQHNKPDDWVVATGEHHTVQEFAEKVFNVLDLDINNHVEIQDIYFRPNEVPALLGDSTKIRTILKWKPEIDFETLISRMVESVWNEEVKHV